MRQNDVKAQPMTHKCVEVEHRHHTVQLDGWRIKAVQWQEKFSRRPAFTVGVAMS